MHSPLHSIPHIFGRMHAPVHRRTCIQHLGRSVFFRCFSSVFFCKSMRVGEKKTQSAGKNTKFQYAIQTLLALGAYSFERTHISFTVLDTPPNKNYCLVSHYSLLVGSNVIHVCFTGSLPSLCLNQSSCFRVFPFFSPWVLSTRPLP